MPNRNPRLEALARALPGSAAVVVARQPGNVGFVLNLIEFPSTDWRAHNVVRGELNVPESRVATVFRHFEQATNKSLPLFLEGDAKPPFTNSFVEVNPRTLEPVLNGRVIGYTAI